MYGFFAGRGWSFRCHLNVRLSLDIHTEFPRHRDCSLDKRGTASQMSNCLGRIPNT